jgi:hypothetical protein
MCPECVERCKHNMVLAERLGILSRALVEARTSFEFELRMDWEKADKSFHQAQIDAIDAALMSIGEPICGVDASYRTNPLATNHESR